MELGSGGEYTLAIHHTEGELAEWGLSPEMIQDQKWRINANRGEWNEQCPWYLDEFFDHVKEAEGNSDKDDGDREAISK